MAKKILPHANVNKEMVEKFQSMMDVFSISCVVADAQERQNVMKSDIKPRTTDKKIIGAALTVKLTAGDLVDCLDIFDIAQPGDVIVVDACGETETSIWGGMMSGLCKNGGILGAIIDGACRDTDEARFLDFPVYAKSVVPRSTHTPISKRMDTIEINVPVTCGGVIVNPGDIIVADEIGVTVVDQAEWELIYAGARKQADMEIATREEILKGKTARELLDKYGRL